MAALLHATTSATPKSPSWSDLSLPIASATSCERVVVKAELPMLLMLLAFFGLPRHNDLVTAGEQTGRQCVETSDIRLDVERMNTSAFKRCFNDRSCGADCIIEALFELRTCLSEGVVEALKDCPMKAAGVAEHKLIGLSDDALAQSHLAALARKQTVNQSARVRNDTLPNMTCDPIGIIGQFE